MDALLQTTDLGLYCPTDDFYVDPRQPVDRAVVTHAHTDHVDWQSLFEAVDACDPDSVWVTHGYCAAVARYLQENGRDAKVIDSRMRSENEEDEVAEQT